MRRTALTSLFLVSATEAQAQITCGGSFANFVNDMKQAARDRGHATQAIDSFFQNVRQDPTVIQADRAQTVFRLTFTEFARRIISQDRLRKGRTNATAHRAIFDTIEAQYGVPRGVMLAFWALETDYGAVQGNFNTLNALMTLSHDCRRPDLFRPQVFAALELFERGAFDPSRTEGAWAGEIGMVQMLPEDIIRHAVDGDGDGEISLKTSVPDALMSGAKLLASLGWRRDAPWLQEIRVPNDLDWSKTGLTQTFTVDEWQAMGVRARVGRFEGQGEASVILPQGRNGPAFLAYPNFRVYFEWNQSFTYVTIAAYFATRLSGAQVFDAGTPDPGLSEAQMISLQQRLAAKGHDVGDVDGILGARTQQAVQMEQSKLGLPADARPMSELLAKL